MEARLISTQNTARVLSVVLKLPQTEQRLHFQNPADCRFILVSFAHKRLTLTQRVTFMDEHFGSLSLADIPTILPSLKGASNSRERNLHSELPPASVFSQQKRAGLKLLTLQNVWRNVQKASKYRQQVSDTRARIPLNCLNAID